MPTHKSMSLEVRRQLVENLSFYHADPGDCVASAFISRPMSHAMHKVDFADS